MSWAAVSGASTYNVEETEPRASVGDVLSAGANRSISMIIFATGTVKSRVQACNGVGCSAWSPYGSVSLQSGD
ncbi:hypothetical protein GCM10009126_32990 [Rhodanobacter caeni]|uniref:Uncharacterized protein n=1 Tax=Rhodanobacter caeni TaxID=657654 RepID=A0ABN0UXK5_9GAMM